MHFSAYLPLLPQLARNHYTHLVRKTKRTHSEFEGPVSPIPPGPRNPSIAWPPHSISEVISVINTHRIHAYIVLFDLNMYCRHTIGCAPTYLYILLNLQYQYYNKITIMKSIADLHYDHINFKYDTLLDYVHRGWSQMQIMQKKSVQMGVQVCIHGIVIISSRIVVTGPV